MKRSEAVKLIRNIIDNLDQDDITIFSETVSSNILKRLEQAGMMPPEISTKEIHPKYGLSYTIRVNRWESEDE